MKQRLGIAQALINDPKILIFDEPTAGLDPRERIRFRNIFSHISKDKIIILSTHIVSDLEYTANNIMHIKEGRLVNNSTVHELLSNLQGMVWEAEISEYNLNNLPSNCRVTAVNREDGTLKIRYVSDNMLFAGSQAVIPRLEDIYVYYLDEEVCM